ncbi:MAG: PQQ-dependent dehydrogenase, methanol/ethanol family, partial [Myxococcota bacterium]
MTLRALALTALLLACDAPAPAPTPEAEQPPALDGPAVKARTASLDGARIAAAEGEPGNWLAHGRTYDEQRHSPLDQIDAENVARLGLAWSFETNTERGHEATPIVVDGAM